MLELPKQNVSNAPAARVAELRASFAEEKQDKGEALIILQQQVATTKYWNSPHKLYTST